MDTTKLLAALREETLPRLPAVHEALEKVRQGAGVEALGPIRELMHKVAGTAALAGLPLLTRHCRFGEELTLMALEGDIKPGRRLFVLLEQLLAALEADLNAPPPAAAKAKAGVSPGVAAPGGGVMNRIVVASDESVSGKLLARFIEEAGFSPRRCTLREASDALPECEVLLLDVPTAATGLPLVHTALANATARHVPVVLVSKPDVHGEELKVLAAHATRFLAKPVLPAALEAEVRLLIAQRLAVAQARSRAPTGQVSSPVPAGDKPVRVLVVDDSRVIRGVVREALAEVGVAVVEAADGAEALKVFDEVSPDAVISDVQMPGVDGTELTRLLRARSKGGRLPIVVLSSLEDEASRAAGLAAGADAYLVKSLIDGPALLKALQAAGLGMSGRR